MNQFLRLDFGCGNIKKIPCLHFACRGFLKGYGTLLLVVFIILVWIVCVGEGIVSHADLLY